MCIVLKSLLVIGSLHPQLCVVQNCSSLGTVLQKEKAPNIFHGIWDCPKFSYLPLLYPWEQCRIPVILDFPVSVLFSLITLDANFLKFWRLASKPLHSVIRADDNSLWVKLPINSVRYLIPWLLQQTIVMG